MDAITTTTAHWTDQLLLKIANLIVYTLFLGSGTYAVAGPVGWGTGVETYITPGVWAFSIFGIIHFLLFGTMIWQFSANGAAKFVQPLSYRFIALGLLSSLWVNLWLSQSYILALLASLAVAAVASESYYVLRANHSHNAKQALSEEIFVHFPFSLWHGWSVVLVFITAFAAFGTPVSQPAGVWTKISVFVALALMEIQAAGYAFSSTQGDVGGSAVITWTLFNIFSHQTSSGFVHWSALAFAIVSLVNLLKSVYGTGANARRITLTEESQPILPN